MDTGEKHITQPVSILKATQWEEIPFPSQRKIYNNQSWNEFIQLIIKEMKAVIGVKARATRDHVPKGKALLLDVPLSGPHTEACFAASTPQAAGKCFLNKRLQIENESRILNSLALRLHCFYIPFAHFTNTLHLYF